MDIDLLLEDIVLDVDDDFDVDMSTIDEIDLDLSPASEAECVANENLGSEIEYPALIIRNMISEEELTVDYNSGLGISVYVENSGIVKKFWEIDLSFTSILNLFRIREYDIDYLPSAGESIKVDTAFLLGRAFIE